MVGGAGLDGRLEGRNARNCSSEAGGRSVDLD